MSRRHMNWGRRWCGVLALVLLVPGLYLLNVTAPTVQGQQQGAGEAGPAFSLAFVPRDVLAFVALRPATLLKRPVLAPVADRLTAMADDQMKLAVAPQDVSSFSTLLLAGGRRDVGVCFRLETTTPEAARKFEASLGAVVTHKTFASIEYKQMPTMCVFTPNDRTVIFAAQEPTMRRCLAAGPTGASTTKWAPAFEAVAQSDGAAVINTAMLRAGMGVEPVAQALRELTPGGDRSSAQYTTLQVAPVWQRSEHAIAELHAEEDVLLRVVSKSATDDEAKQVHSALLTAISVARVTLSSGRHEAVSNDKPESAELLSQIDLLDEILEQAVIARREAQVGFVARIGRAVAGRAAQTLAPTIAASQEASYRRKSMNNLKQIALAFHNYHDTYKTFPAAVQIGPKNVPHSWRVTILPFVEGSALYEAYRQDEPWDSEHNKSLLAQMPDVYRFPGDQANSTNSSCFGFLGPQALFQENRGARMADIRDGTSNTLLVVESKRDVPWTKPDEIAFDPEGPAPPVGGWYSNGFHGAMCDGSVRFFSDDLEEQTFKYLIMRADGNPIRLPRR